LAPKKKVFVQFTSSERLTAQLREGFATRGFEVVATKDEELLPEPLFQAAMAALTTRLFAAPKAAQ
jgi:hypothetical protein